MRNHRTNSTLSFPSSVIAAVILLACIAFLAIPLAAQSTPTINTAFGSPSINLYGNVVVVFSIPPVPPGSSFMAVEIRNALPSGLVVANPAAVLQTCPSATVVAIPGTGSIHVLPFVTGYGCVITVNVTATSAGLKHNTPMGIITPYDDVNRTYFPGTFSFPYADLTVNNPNNSITGTVSAAFAASPATLSATKVRLFGPIANNSRTATLSPLVATTTTDATGGYTFRPVAATDATHHYALTFEKAGFISSSVNANVAVNSGVNTDNVALLPALQLNAVCADKAGDYSWRLRNGTGATFNYSYGVLRGTASGSGTISNSDVPINITKASAGLGIMQVRISGYTVASAQAQNLSCPTATVTGKVTDSVTTNPLNGATVTVKDANNNTVGTGATNSSGVYTISGISINSQVNTNPYSVAISAPGYNNSSASVTLGGGQSVTQNAQLTASAATGTANIGLTISITPETFILVQSPPFPCGPNGQTCFSTQCQLWSTLSPSFIPDYNATVVVLDINNNMVAQLTGTTTNSGVYGIYSFPNLPNGDYQYTVGGGAPRSGSGRFSVIAGQTTNITLTDSFTIQPSGPCLPPFPI